MATFNQVYPPQFTFAPVYGHSKPSELLDNGMESPAQYTTQSEPDSRRNSVCPQQYMDYNQQQFGHTFAPACNTFAAADNHSFAAANTFASACSTFNNNQLAANNFANQPPLMSPTSQTQQAFQGMAFNASLYTHSTESCPQDAAVSHPVVEEEPSVELEGTRFTKTQIIEIYSLRSAATAGGDALHKKAAGRSVVVAQLYSIPAKTIRDIWTRELCADWTSDKWTRHESVLFECSELIKAGKIPPRTEKLREKSRLEKSKSSSSLMGGSAAPVAQVVSQRGGNKKRKSMSDCVTGSEPMCAGKDELTEENVKKLRSDDDWSWGDSFNFQPVVPQLPIGETASMSFI